MVRLVLKAGASPDIYDTIDGSTAMSLAIGLDNRQIITLLRDAQR